MTPPDDRPGAGVGNPPAGAAPAIYVIVDGKKFLRPGLETMFARPAAKGEKGRPPRTSSQVPDGCSCNPVGGSYCSCNKVCTCVPACGCAGHRTCGCVSHRSCTCAGRSSGGYGCRCAPVH